MPSRPFGDLVGPPPEVQCDLVLPGRDEAAALVALLPLDRPGFHPVVVDKGSQECTAEVASRLGAQEVGEATAGYGVAGHAGVLASTSEHVAVMDADGSCGARVLWWLRRRTGLPIRDIAPLRVSRRDDRLALGVGDRRSGYPLELLQPAHAAGWRITETDMAFHLRVAGMRSTISGSVTGSSRASRDFAKVLS